MPVQEDLFWREYHRLSERIAQKGKLVEETLERGRVIPLTAEEIHRAKEASEQRHKLEIELLELMRIRPKGRG